MSIGEIICIIFGLLFAILIIRFIIIDHENKKKNVLELNSESVSNTLEEKACVLNKEYYMKITGRDSHTDEYIITFSILKGGEKEFHVSMEDYNKINIGEKGILITQNTFFYNKDDIPISKYNTFIDFDPLWCFINNIIIEPSPDCRPLIVKT